jgi:hypothetical protein
MESHKSPKVIVMREKGKSPFILERRYFYGQECKRDAFTTGMDEAEIIGEIHSLTLTQ